MEDRKWDEGRENPKAMGEDPTKNPPSEEPEAPVEYTGAGDWGRQASWGAFGTRASWAAEAEWEYDKK